MNIVILGNIETWKKFIVYEDGGGGSFCGSEIREKKIPVETSKAK
jgi:hypothetical protein